MGKLNGFRGSKGSTLTKRAAEALKWLIKQPGGNRTFVTWTELYAALVGASPDTVDPAEVKERLRNRGTYVKAFLIEEGYGWMSHPSDRSLIRATAPGKDSALNCEPYYRRRLRRAAEKHVDVVSKTVGDPRAIIRTKDDPESLSGLSDAYRKAKSLLDVIDPDGTERAAQVEPRKKASSG